MTWPLSPPVNKFTFSKEETAFSACVTEPSQPEAHTNRLPHSFPALCNTTHITGSFGRKNQKTLGLFSSSVADFDWSFVFLWFFLLSEVFGL